MNPLPSDSPSYKGRPIRSIESLAKALWCRSHRLAFVSEQASDLYRVAKEIPKADGTVRRTYDAKKLLKDIHRLIKTEILDRVYFPPYLTGSLRGQDYKTNADIHVGAAIVIAEDIGNFFPSTTAERVLDVWHNFFRFSAEVAQCLTNLTTRNNELPQGAITSPQLANLVFWRNEPQLHARLKAEGVDYSRFVDDVVASSKTPIAPERKTEIIAAIYGLMKRSGYQPKRRKHELKTARERMTVTTLTVNDAVGIPKEERSRIRAAVHRLERLVVSAGNEVDLKHEYAVAAGRVNNLARFHPGEARTLKKRLAALDLR